MNLMRLPYTSFDSTRRDRKLIIVALDVLRKIGMETLLARILIRTLTRRNTLRSRRTRRTTLITFTLGTPRRKGRSLIRLIARRSSLLLSFVLLRRNWTTRQTLAVLLFVPWSLATTYRLTPLIRRSLELIFRSFRRAIPLESCRTILLIVMVNIRRMKWRR